MEECKILKMNNLRKYVMALSLAVVLTACSSPEGNFPGSEYMPDMAHSVAKEANLLDDYYYNTWDDRSTISLYELVSLNEPVEHTIPRGYAGKYAGERSSDNEVYVGANGMSVPVNGHVPYHYADSPEGREAAIAELLDNPFPITEDGLVRGGVLYNTFCGICHGNAGNGLGYIYDEEQNPNAKYPLAPANFLTDQFYEASNGRYYNAIYYGYNAMGAYKDKLSYEERWQVIHYIRGLQAKEKGVEYSATANTLNPAFGTPAADWSPEIANNYNGSLEAESMMAEDKPSEVPGEHSSDGDGKTTILKKK